MSNPSEIVVLLYGKRKLWILFPLRNSWRALTNIKLGSCGVAAIIVIVVVRLLVWGYGAGLAGSYAGQLRAGGDQVGNANESHTCAVQVHLTQLHTTQELQTWDIKHMMLEMFLYTRTWFWRGYQYATYRDLWFWFCWGWVSAAADSELDLVWSLYRQPVYWPNPSPTKTTWNLNF